MQGSKLCYKVDITEVVAPSPCPGAVADNLGVLSGRVPVLSGHPIIRGKHWYIGRETRGSGGGGGVAVGDQGAVGRPQGKEENGRSFLCYQKRLLVCSHLCLFFVYVFESLADFPQLKMKSTQW